MTPELVRSSQLCRSSLCPSAWTCSRKLHHDLLLNGCKPVCLCWADLRINPRQTSLSLSFTLTPHPHGGASLPVCVVSHILQLWLRGSSSNCHHHLVQAPQWSQPVLSQVGGVRQPQCVELHTTERCSLSLWRCPDGWLDPCSTTLCQLPESRVVKKGMNVKQRRRPGAGQRVKKTESREERWSESESFIFCPP